jgi:ubiquinone biosynthesis protein COQ4
MHLGKLLYMLRAFRAGAPLGDVVMLKVDALSSPPRAFAEKLAPVRGYAPEHDLAALRGLPAGTLGREYARFLDANGITPLVVSGHVKERFRDRPYALRYTLTHDLHHVLTGFDAGLAGEMGVLAFNVGQGSAPIRPGMLWVARCLYAMLAPSQARRIWHDVGVGLEMGRRAELVMAAPIESWFEEALDEVRRRLRIPDPGEAGVLPSGASFVGNLLYPPKASHVG